MSQIKITDLPLATKADITPGDLQRSAGNVVIPIVDGTTTKQITIDELFKSQGSIELTGSMDVSGSSTLSGSLLTTDSLTALGSNVFGHSKQYLNHGTTHAFYGNVTSSGNVSSSGTIISDTGTFTTLNVNGNANFNLSNLSIAGNTTSSGNFEVVGNISGSNTSSLTVGGAVNFPTANTTFSANTITLGNASSRINLDGNILTRLQVSSHITASGNISSSGNVSGNTVTARNNITTTGGDLVGVNLQVGNITASGDISSSGTLIFDGISVTSVTGSIISSSGHVLGTQFKSFDKVIGLYHAASDTVRLAQSGIPVKVYGSAIDLREAPITASIISASGTIFADRFESATGGSSIDFNDDLDLTGHDITARSGSFQYITASVVDVDANTIRIGGTSLSKTDLDDLKLGKPIATGDAKTAGKSLTHPGDTGTFIKQKSTAPGRVDHIVSNKVLLQMTTGSFVIGNAIEQNTPIKLVGTTEITGSTTVSGSADVTGSLNVTGGSATFDCGNNGFGVNNLLDLLENFGNTGIPTGSDGLGNALPGGGVGAGDINLDGQVNISDLLLLLSGYGNPAIICSPITIAPNVNSTLAGPTITISSSITVTVSDTATLKIF